MPPIQMEEHLSLRVDPDEKSEAHGVEESLIQSVECRICQEEDIIENVEVPCACSGSLKFAHRKCVQRWCNEKRDIVCEICRQPYKPGYTAPPPQSDDTLIDISDPRVSAMSAAEQQRLIESDYDEYEDSGASSASLCRSAAIILMALLLLRHSLSIGDDDSDDDDDPSVIFALFLLRAAEFLLPCYILVWAIGILQRCRQTQEDESLAAANVPFMTQAEQHRGLNVTIAPGPVVAPTPTSTPPVISTHDTIQ
ncbi:putative E3 ubiquitin-protein ligase MARCH [Helianthus annuus]|uniref:E3 ubiquitin-protein ligase MARCH n=1 Tax=Helianthus annuus TaxID=4232 RepID=A0A9K3NE31_HELAN|nr:putative E3 ubiquitin-protein ligase MARCH [Helianthus annuus]KAJ0540091.1 putative E3 ubiquitin-protein ligase MARCH [Helianthus annuus]KAJ0548509.1 putative E3 ubiquitin-protein ligase MARCH [Helianthus annuus]KAJ0554832.1 putative E3 ubiquitin-protein ligase MARCH [Helianthus annuus]KAJ0720398.1 putative E3 ubiquitin-protein ligase MARCH [Helianthus annuus]